MRNTSVNNPEDHPVAGYLKIHVMVAKVCTLFCKPKHVIIRAFECIILYCQYFDASFILTSIWLSELSGWAYQQSFHTEPRYFHLLYVKGIGENDKMHQIFGSRFFLSSKVKTCSRFLASLQVKHVCSHENIHFTWF